MTHGSLFSGIGGFELGAERAGIQNIWNCEIDPFCRKILKQHYPKTVQYEDIRNLHNPPKVDILSGGFPCQDISVSGKGVGIHGERSGLWKEMYRIIREIKPRYIIIENSPALTIRGMEYILCNLSESGYNAEWQCISNCQFGYPHKRERIYIIAYSNSYRWGIDISRYEKVKSIFRKTPTSPDISIAAKRFYQLPDTKYVRTNDGVPDRVHRIKVLGNSVNPTITEYLFKCILNFDKNINTKNKNDHGRK